jgi:hypothetical protein
LKRNSLAVLSLLAKFLLDLKNRLASQNHLGKNHGGSVKKYIAPLLSLLCASLSLTSPRLQPPSRGWCCAVCSSSRPPHYIYTSNDSKELGDLLFAHTLRAENNGNKITSTCEPFVLKALDIKSGEFVPTVLRVNNLQLCCLKNVKNVCLDLPSIAM